MINSNGIHMHPSRKYILDIIEHEPTTLDELAHAVIKVINHSVDRKNKPIKIAGFAWNIDFRNKVSNTHRAPHNGITNWGNRHPDRPTGYSGFYGRLWLRYSEYVDGFGSDSTDKSLTHTGTGGAGTYDGPWVAINKIYWDNRNHSTKKSVCPEPQVYSWDYTIFLEDWPGIQQMVERQQIWNILNDKPFSINHKFLWNDPEIEAQDNLIISKFSEKK